MAFTTTHKSFVNSWECDENDHMNVQFYFKRFAHAGEIFALQHDRDREQGSRPAMRHVRFHHELRENTSTGINTAVIMNGTYQGHIAHLLIDLESGRVCATALDLVDFSTRGLPSIDAEEALGALPRGIAGGVEAAINTVPLLQSGAAIISNIHVVHPEDCDGQGNLASQHYIARFTDGASHIWNHAGLTTDWLEQNQYGRVAVEMKLCPLREVKAATPLRQVSWLADMSEKSFRMHHQIEDLVSGEALATGVVVGLVLDHQTRRAVPIRAEALEKFKASELAVKNGLSEADKIK